MVKFKFKVIKISQSFFSVNYKQIIKNDQQSLTGLNGTFYCDKCLSYTTQPSSLQINAFVIVVINYQTSFIINTLISLNNFNKLETKFPEPMVISENVMPHINNSPNPLYILVFEDKVNM